MIKKLWCILSFLFILMGLCACETKITSVTMFETVIKYSESENPYFTSSMYEITDNEHFQIFNNDFLNNENIIEYNGNISLDFNLNRLVIIPIYNDATYLNFSDIEINDYVITGTLEYGTSGYVQGKNNLSYYATHFASLDGYVLCVLNKEVDVSQIDNKIILKNIDYDGSIERIDDHGYICYKPIIYLYPTENMHLNIQFKDASYLLTTYPRYNNGWDIDITTDGTLIDAQNKHYYALYYDETCHYNCDFTTGFYVKGEDAIEFLEDKLAILGFTEREMNECIMYWLPILEDNGYSQVYFEQTEERNLECPLCLSQPMDSMLRIIIHIKKISPAALNNPLKEEILCSFTRKGNTLIEWGGVSYE